jgi:erythromycin esterase-like protein
MLTVGGGRNMRSGGESERVRETKKWLRTRRGGRGIYIGGRGEFFMTLGVQTSRSTCANVVNYLLEC